MPWVHEELRHDHILDDFWNVILRRYTDASGNYWWADYSEDLEKIDAFKISFEPGLLVSNCDGDYIPNHKFPDAEEGGYIALTRHMIIKRWDGELLGLAQSTGAIKMNPLLYSIDPVVFLEELSGLFYDTVDYTTIYAYMLDKYTNHTHFEDEEGNIHPITFIAESQFNGVLASSLDIEFHNEGYYGKEMMQSPIMTLDLVYGQSYSVGAIGKMNFKTDTNWWNDSKILIQGNIDTNSFCFILRADNAPIWHDGRVPQTPFFFGDVIDKVTKEFMPVAMFGGRAVDKNFDFDNTDIITNEAIMPTTRNYVHYPSNGIDSVMFKRSRFGSRYQAHYLSWEVPPNEIPPARERYEVNKQAYEFAKSNKFFEDALAEGISEDTTTFKFKPYGIAEPTDVLDWKKATHVLIDGIEIVELVSYDDKNWTMTVKRILEKPLSHNNGAVLWGLDKKMADMFLTKRVRSWNNLTNDPNYYKYTPHPSRYSNKIHTSRIYMVHPEEGVVGELPNAVVATSINLYDGTRLTFTKPCEDGECEEYEVPERPESKGFLNWVPKPNSFYTDDDEFEPPTDPGDGGDGGNGGNDHDHPIVEDGAGEETSKTDPQGIYELETVESVVGIGMKNDLPSPKKLHVWAYQVDPDLKPGTASKLIPMVKRNNVLTGSSSPIGNKIIGEGESGNYYTENAQSVYIVVEDDEGNPVKLGTGGMKITLSNTVEVPEGYEPFGDDGLPPWEPKENNSGNFKPGKSIKNDELLENAKLDTVYKLDDSCMKTVDKVALTLGSGEVGDVGGDYIINLYDGDPISGGKKIGSIDYFENLQYTTMVVDTSKVSGTLCVVFTKKEGGTVKDDMYIIPTCWTEDLQDSYEANPSEFMEFPLS